MGNAQSTFTRRLRGHLRTRSWPRPRTLSRPSPRKLSAPIGNPEQEELINKNRNRPDYSGWVTYSLAKVVFDEEMFTAPVRDVLRHGAKVLGIGTAIGPWLTDAQRNYPNSSFTGLELPNTMLCIDPPTTRIALERTDTVDHFPFDSETFDFVVITNIALEVTKPQWDAIIAEAIRVLIPGGWLEVHENDMVHADMGPKCQKMSDICTTALFTQGIDGSQVQHLKEILEFSGYFANVERKDVRVYLDRSNEKYGPILRERMRLIAEEVSPIMAKALGVDPEQFVDLADRVVYVEMAEYGTSSLLTRVYGQRI